MSTASRPLTLMATFAAVLCAAAATHGKPKFDLSAIPASAVLKEAYLQMFVCESLGKRGGYVPEMEAYEVLKDWSAGRGTGSRWRKEPILEGEASWLCSRHPTRWGAPGCSAPGKDRSEKPVGSGTVQADQWGLIRLKQVLVMKGRNRVRVVRAGNR